MSFYVQIQSIDDEENLVRDTIQNYKKKYKISPDYKILNISQQTSVIINIIKNDVKILDQFSYDFNKDKKVDKVELVQEQNKIKLVFYQNSGSDYNEIYESFIPHKHVFIEKDKFREKRGLAISLVEKQQSIIAYIRYNETDKKFIINELCHILNETTPVGYQLREKCQNITLNISDLDFVKALEIVN